MCVCAYIQVRVVHLVMRDTVEQEIYQRTSGRRNVTSMMSSQTADSSITGVQVSARLGDRSEQKA